MTGRPYKARGWIFEVEDAAAPGTYITLGNLLSWMLNPAKRRGL